MDILTSLHGKRFGLSKDGDLVLNNGANQRVIRGGGNIVNCTASTLTVTADLHAGKIITLNRAAGITVTLPAASGTGNEYTFFTATTFTSNGIIQVANATDIMQGGVSVSTDAGGVTILAAATSDTITMNGSTSGGIKGSWVKLVDVASGIFMVSGFIVSTGAEATPFSAAVS
jgi:hypothetical protein